MLLKEDVVVAPVSTTPKKNQREGWSDRQPCSLSYWSAAPPQVPNPLSRDKGCEGQGHQRCLGGTELGRSPRGCFIWVQALGEFQIETKEQGALKRTAMRCVQTISQSQVGKQEQGSPCRSAQPAHCGSTRRRRCFQRTNLLAYREQETSSPGVDVSESWC